MPDAGTRNAVTATAAGGPAEAAAHFGGLLALETDCWDVHEAMGGGDPGLVLVDARAALRRARLGRPVKETTGGIEGWKDEGFSLVAGA